MLISRSSGVAGRALEVTLTNSTVANNTLAAAANGAGIFNDKGTLTLTNSTVSGNTATAGSGGGILNDHGIVTLDGSSISGNTVSDRAAGIFNISGPLVLLGSTVSDNHAIHAGGGIFNIFGTATLLNTTISGNTAEYAGGVENLAGTLALAFATVAGNSASSFGGGLYTSGYKDAPGTTTLGQSVILGNSAPRDEDCGAAQSAFAALTSVGYNVVGTATGCPSGGSGDTTALSPASVLKEVLADNGGPTKTHALVFGSPAINRVPCINTIDQRGVARPQGGNCDSGAFEATTVATATLTLATNGGTIGRSPAGNGSGPFTYDPGMAVTLTPKPGGGKIFIGWTVDGLYKGWAHPLTIAMNADYTVKANYVTPVIFPDVSEGRADAVAIVALASRGAIKGYANGNYGPDDGVTRAQMAALIARAMPNGPGTPSTILTPPACLVAGTWDCEQWGTPFADGQGFDANLWRNIGALAHYGVSMGYTPAACAALGRPSPCFGPNDPVSYAQTISFITRAMVAKGYWLNQPNAPQPYAGVLAAHAADVATFVYYTGGIPATPSGLERGCDARLVRAGALGGA